MKFKKNDIILYQGGIDGGPITDGSDLAVVLHSLYTDRPFCFIEYHFDCGFQKIPTKEVRLFEEPEYGLWEKVGVL